LEKSKKNKILDRLFFLKQFRIRNKLITVFLIFILFFGIIGYISLDISKSALEKEIGENSILLAKQTLDKIDRDIYNKIEEFQYYCKQSSIIEACSESNQEFEKFENIQNYIEEKDNEWVSSLIDTITPFMQGLINNSISVELSERMKFYEEMNGYYVINEAFITNKYGANIIQTGKTSDYYQADEDWWQNTKINGMYIKDVEFDESANIYSIDICLNIDDEEGNFLGIMKIVFNIESIIEILKEIESYGCKEYMDSEAEYHETMELKLLTHDKKIIYSTEDEYEFFEDIPSEFFSRFGEVGEDGHIHYFIDEGDTEGEGEELFAHVHSTGYKTFEGLDWILIIEHETKEIFSSVIKLRNTALMLLFGGIFFAVILGVFISKSLVNPINMLKDNAKKISEGNLDIQIKTSSKDEIGELSNLFDNMRINLKESFNKLTSLNEELKISEGELRAKNIDLKETHEILQTVNNNLESKVIDRTNEVEKLLKQKDEFINQLSHDLKTPLTPFITLLPLLQKRINDNPENQQIFETLNKSTKRLKSMILKIVEYAKLNALVELKLEETDLSSLINESIENFKDIHYDDTVVFNNMVTDKLSVLVSPFHITSVISNLFSNAAKYSTENNCNIVIDAKQGKDEKIIVSITDDGIGLTPEQIKYIFDEFYKVDESRHDLNSSGLGLSICKRIIDLDDEKIWAESEGIGKGCTFYFTLKSGGENE